MSGPKGFLYFLWVSKTRVQDLRLPCWCAFLCSVLWGEIVWGREKEGFFGCSVHNQESVLSVLSYMALAWSLTLSGLYVFKKKKRSQNLLVGWHEGLMLRV